ncbi:hypothetical protein LWI29_014957 [Acer saccharum]|uniref:Uncharacterized protein n=1 Tax=Acer saccharum TaxID=4024 RepID=A0AA39RDS4_ACESA|nr:hypothetical protein LWI29_014957 [Acer saccharum]
MLRVSVDGVDDGCVLGLGKRDIYVGKVLGMKRAEVGQVGKLITSSSRAYARRRKSPSILEVGVEFQPSGRLASSHCMNPPSFVVSLERLEGEKEAAKGELEAWWPWRFGLMEERENFCMGG